MNVAHTALRPRHFAVGILEQHYRLDDVPGEWRALVATHIQALTGATARKRARSASQRAIVEAHARDIAALRTREARNAALARVPGRLRGAVKVAAGNMFMAKGRR